MDRSMRDRIIDVEEEKKWVTIDTDCLDSSPSYRKGS